MTYKLIFTEKFTKKLDSITKKDRERILKKIDLLKENPFLGKRLVNSYFFKLRIGKYRVIYDVRGNLLEIFLLEVALRKKVYKNI